MIPNFLVTAVALLIDNLFPNAPEWSKDFVTEAIPASIELVELVDDCKDLPPSERLEFVVVNLRDYFDKLDTIPGWAELSEDRRDRILAGLAEIALLFSRADKSAPTNAPRKRGLKKFFEGLNPFKK